MLGARSLVLILHLRNTQRSAFNIFTLLGGLVTGASTVSMTWMPEFKARAKTARGQLQSPEVAKLSGFLFELRCLELGFP